MGPTYFTRVCVPVSDNTARSSLCSAQRGDLFVPTTRTKLGTRSFSVAAPTVWNSLPTELCSTSVSRDIFKSRLKSHFYADAYLHQVRERSRLRQTMTLTLTMTYEFELIKLGTLNSTQDVEYRGASWRGSRRWLVPNREWQREYNDWFVLMIAAGSWSTERHGQSSDLKQPLEERLGTLYSPWSACNSTYLYVYTLRLPPRLRVAQGAITVK